MAHNRSIRGLTRRKQEKKLGVTTRSPSDAEMAALMNRAKKYGASDEEINAAVTLPALRELADMYTSMSTERTGPPEEAPLRPTRRKPRMKMQPAITTRQNKGGLSKKPKFMKGGSYKGKSHMYAAGGMVKELKI